MDNSAGGVVLLLGAYFLPAIVAYSYKHRNRTAVLLLNLFLGRTVIGWLVALIMATWKDK